MQCFTELSQYGVQNFMSKSFNVAVAGATGAVGVEMLKTLEKRNFPVKNLRLLASARSAGKTMKFRGEDIVIEELTENSFKGMDIALFSAGGDISRQFRKSVVDSGAVMIDNSSAFRLEADVPLVVPEVNPEDIAKHNGVIANPNCSTIIMLVAVAPLHTQNVKDCPKAEPRPFIVVQLLQAHQSTLILQN